MNNPYEVRSLEIVHLMITPENRDVCDILWQSIEIRFEEGISPLYLF